MTLKYTVSVEPCFDFLSQDYQNLFGASEATVFQSPLWQHYIHKILMPNLEARPFTIVIRSQKDQKICVVFPFIIQKAILGMEIIQFSDFGVCDYNAVVGNRSVLDMVVQDQDVLKKLEKITNAGHLLLVRKMREDVFDISRFFKNMTRTTNESATYNCAIGGDVQAWKRKKLSKSWLKNLRRTERKFTADAGAWTFLELKTEQQLHKAMVVIRKMHTKRFEDSLIQHDIYNKFYTDYIMAAVEKGDAVMYELTLDDDTIATEFGFLHQQSYQGILVAAETEKYAKYSPGYQMIFKVIEDITDKGYQNFDLGIGNQDYKQKFRADETKLYDCTAALSLRGRLVAPIYHYIKPLKNILKKYVPHVH